MGLGAVELAKTIRRASIYDERNTVKQLQITFHCRIILLGTLVALPLGIILLTLGGNDSLYLGISCLMIPAVLGASVALLVTGKITLPVLQVAMAIGTCVNLGLAYHSAGLSAPYKLFSVALLTVMNSCINNFRGLLVYNFVILGAMLILIAFDLWDPKPGVAGSSSWRADFGFHFGVVVFFFGVLAETAYSRVKTQRALAHQLEEGERSMHNQQAMLQYLSHEIRNALVPIQAVLGETSPGECAVADSPSTRCTASQFRLAADRLRDVEKLLGDVQRVSELGAGAHKFVLEPKDVSGIVREVANAAANAEHKAPIVNDTSSHRMAQVDVAALKQVVRNLVRNMLRYCDSSAVVEIEDADNNGTRIVFRNDGVPIDEREMPQLFELFNLRSHRRGGGSGLGLSEVRLLCDGMGARVEAESTPQQTVFRVTLAGASTVALDVSGNVLAGRPRRCCELWTFS